MDGTSDGKGSLMMTDQNEPEAKEVEDSLAFLISKNFKKLNHRNWFNRHSFIASDWTLST
jgi:hypothetical protein